MVFIKGFLLGLDFLGVLGICGVFDFFFVGIRECGLVFEVVISWLWGDGFFDFILIVKSKGSFGGGGKRNVLEGSRF